MTNPLPLHPFSLELDLLDRMLNFEIADDPHYSGLEIQAFDDPAHGRGTVVFFNRRSDGKTDVYFEAGLTLDPDNYAIGEGLGLWVEAEFERSRLEVSDHGVVADVLFTDAAGRSIEVHASDRTPRGRNSARFLAPMGAAIATPNSLPLIWMSKFDLLRRTGPAPTVLIDGRAAKLGRLPVEWLTRRRLVKVTSDLCGVLVNPTGPSAPLGDMPAADDTEVADGGTKAIVGRSGGHEVRFEFDPPFSDLRGNPGNQHGRWTVSIDRTRLVAGTWQVVAGAETTVRLNVTEGWRPVRLPLLMRIVTRVAPVFRTWPTTYRWEATISENGMMTSTWQRTETDRGESYRKLTASG